MFNIQFFVRFIIHACTPTNMTLEHIKMTLKNHINMNPSLLIPMHQVCKACVSELKNSPTYIPYKMKLKLFKCCFINDIFLRKRYPKRKTQRA